MSVVEKEVITRKPRTVATGARAVRAAAVAGVDVWVRYEARKRELSDDLSPSEYTSACRRIARELGA